MHDVICVSFALYEGREIHLGPPAFVSLSRQLGNHCEQRHVQGNHDATDHHAEQADNDGLQHGKHVFGGAVHFVLIEVCDFLQHVIHCTGSLADSDHLRHHVREDTASAQTINDGATFF